MKPLSSTNFNHYLLRYLQLPRWQQRFISAVFACLPAILFFYFSILPAQERLHDLQQEQSTLLIQHQQLMLHYDQYPKAKMLEYMQRTQSDLQHPDKKDYFEKVITHYLKQSNSQLVLLKSLSSEQNEFLTTQKWQLKLIGSYGQLIQFITLLTESDHLLTFEPFTLEKQNEQLNLSFILHLHHRKRPHYE